MTDRSNTDITTRSAVRPAAVRVKLEPINCDVARNLPADGEGCLDTWRHRLKAALGTVSEEFIDSTLFQLQAAARLPNSGLSEIAVNAALAFIESAKPEAEWECALVVQMACTHTAAMAVLARLGGGHGGDRHITAAATAASRLLRTFAFQVETLRRLKHGGSQIIRIERVDVRDGGQAVIGKLK